MLGSGGTGLSGGERRRLLLARAFLVGAGVLLLDEPGEHLDPQTADALVRDVLTGGRGARAEAGSPGTTPGPGITGTTPGPGITGTTPGRRSSSSLTDSHR